MGRSHKRRLWLLTHRYLGLVVGTWLVLAGLSGSLIVFAWHLDARLNRDVMRVAAPADGRWLALDKIVASAREVMPQGAQLGGMVFPKTASDVFRINFSIPPSPDGYELFVHPYTGQVLGMRMSGDFQRCCSWHGPLMAVIYRFHDSLWLGEVGLMAVGSMGLLMLIALISGVALWWPSPGTLKRALSIKRGASIQRFVFDVHCVGGILGLPMLAMLLFTGAYLSFPEQAKALVGLMSPLSANPEVLASSPCKAHLGLDALVAIADRAMPEGRLDSISFPEPGRHVFVIYRHADFEVMTSFSRRSVQVDACDGTLRHVEDRQRRSAGDVFDEWQIGLHGGGGLGLLGQILVLLTGFLPSLLYITGVIRWMQKRRARASKGH